MQTIETVGIISKPKIDHAGGDRARIAEWLDEQQSGIVCDQQTALYAGMEPLYSREEVPDRRRLIIVLGGDGTLLSAARVTAGAIFRCWPSTWVRWAS